jgi:hypothetical protein
MTQTIPPSQLEFAGRYMGWTIYRSSAGFEAYKSKGLDVIGRDEGGEQWMKTDLQRLILPGETFEEAAAALYAFHQKPKSRKRKDTTIDMFEESTQGC